MLLIARSEVKLRDYDEYYEREHLLEAEGTGPIEGQTIRVCGLFGGGLPTITEDNWAI